MINGAILAFGATGWGYLKILFAYIQDLSATGKIFMLVMFLIAVSVSAGSLWWYPALALKKAKKKYSDIEWMALPKIGYYPPFIVFFLLFPIFGLFTSRTDTWWVFMIEGWLIALIILLFVRVVRKMTLAIMKTNGKYYLSKRCGLFNWIPANELPNLSADKEKYIGYNSYGLYYEKDGVFKKFGYLSDANFPLASLPWLREFIRTYQPKV